MNKEINWLKENGRWLKIRPIEQALNMPEGTLKKFVDGRRDLPENWHKPVSDWVIGFLKS